MTEMQINYRNLQESRRHNLETERLTGEAQEEIKRSNLAREAETYRHNVATLAETTRANQAKEALQHQANVINQSHYERLDSINQAHYQRMDAETSTHNENVEYETQRHNKVVEAQQQVTTTSQATERAANVGLTNAKTKQTLLQSNQQKIVNQYAEPNQKLDLYNKGVSAVDKTVGVVDSIIETISNGLNLFGVRKNNDRIIKLRLEK